MIISYRNHLIQTDLPDRIQFMEKKFMGRHHTTECLFFQTRRWPLWANALHPSSTTSRSRRKTPITASNGFCPKAFSGTPTTRTSKDTALCSLGLLSPSRWAPSASSINLTSPQEACSSPETSDLTEVLAPFAPRWTRSRPIRASARKSSVA